MIKGAIASLISGRSLTMEEAALVMEEIMQGEVTPAQFGAFVTSLRMKGETADEITGLASVMRAKAIRVMTADPVIDVVGAMTVLTLAIVAAVMVAELATNNVFQLDLGVVGYLAANVGVALLALIFGVLALTVGAVSGKRGYAIGIAAAVAIMAVGTSLFAWSRKRL